MAVLSDPIFGVSDPIRSIVLAGVSGSFCSTGSDGSDVAAHFTQKRFFGSAVYPLRGQHRHRAEKAKRKIWAGLPGG